GDLVMIGVARDSGRGGGMEAIKAGADNFVGTHEAMRLIPVVERALREAEIRRARHRAEKALRESGERFAQAFAHAPIGMAIVGIDGITLQVNRAFCDMLGYTETEVAGLPVWRFTHPDDMPATIEQLQRLVEGESDAWCLEKRFFHRDGHTIWARSNTWLVRGVDGIAQYVVSQLQDITEHRRLEEQMQRQQAELAHVLRVATMGETGAQFAHEINQPLASISNFANGLVLRLSRPPKDVEALRAAATHIASEALRASEVVRRLRTFLRKVEVRRECCAANDLVRDAVRLMHAEFRRHAIVLELDLNAEGIVVEVNRVQVGQVVLNLLRNSIEAMTDTHTHPRQLGVKTAASPKETVVVSVHDSGVGLPRLAGD